MPLRTPIIEALLAGLDGEDVAGDAPPTGAEEESIGDAVVGDPSSPVRAIGAESCLCNVGTRLLSLIDEVQRDRVGGEAAALFCVSRLGSIALPVPSPLPRKLASESRTEEVLPARELIRARHWRSYG